MKTKDITLQELGSPDKYRHIINIDQNEQY